MQILLPAAAGHAAPLQWHIVRASNRSDKSGVVILASFDGVRDPCTMIGGARAMPSPSCVVDLFKPADGCGLSSDPDRGRA